MRSFILIFVFSFLAGITTFSQRIELQVDDQPPYELFKTVAVTVFIINDTDRDLIYFDSNKTSYDSYEEQWMVKIDSQSVDADAFKDGHHGKFTQNNIVVLAPGHRTDLKHRLVSLMSPGRYSVLYEQTQNPDLVKKHFAANGTAYAFSQDITPFTVSGSVAFDVEGNLEMKVIEPTFNVSWNEWTEYREKKLYAEDHYFRRFEDALNSPGEVYALSLNAFGLTGQMLSKLEGLKNLKALKIGSLKQDEMPAVFARIPIFEMTIFPESGQQIRFPQEYKSMDSLRRFTYHGQQPIPEWILYAENLEYLELRDFTDTSLPDLRALKNLEELIIISDNLETIENSGIDKIPSLRRLEITCNENFSAIDPVSNCDNLEIFRVSFCNIEELPEDIGKMQNLRELRIPFIQIDDIPESIGKLKNLEVLGLAGNKNLKRLPPAVTRLSSLVELDISKSGVEELPEGISNLPLKRVYVNDSDCKKNKDYQILKKRLGDNFRK